jgi:hypothetical protein
LAAGVGHDGLNLLRRYLHRCSKCKKPALRGLLVY